MDFSQIILNINLAVESLATTARSMSIGDWAKLYGIAQGIAIGVTGGLAWAAWRFKVQKFVVEKIEASHKNHVLKTDCKTQHQLLTAALNSHGELLEKAGCQLIETTSAMHELHGRFEGMRELIEMQRELMETHVSYLKDAKNEKNRDDRDR